ncbi:DNA adenine methylase [Plantactinospora solaniradicis]|uniref:DNA adenine methylase n=1 Tax=Plantactinospora solaniradicis TaxID=1723736 RepID=A0ABW1K950_9ACTN
MKPPVRYYGGKARMAERVVSMLPPHRLYVEPFAGSCAVLFAKEPARFEIINDLSGDVVTFFRVLRDRPGDLIAALEATPYARTEFEACRDEDLTGQSSDEIEQARRWWVRQMQGFNAIPDQSKRVGWSVSNASCNPATRVDGYLRRMPAVAKRLRRVQIEQRSAVKVVAQHGRASDAVLYVDPPYVAETRNDRGIAYQMEMTPADHRALAAALHEACAAVVLSGYASPLYDELYADWTRLDIAVTRPTSNRAGKQGALGTEVLWLNRAFDETRRVFDEMKCECGCGQPLVRLPVGRRPKYFSALCRQKAYLRRRASA